MSVNANAIIDGILLKEGSTYTNDPADRGGPTKFGITQRTLSQHRGRPVTAAEVEALTEADARGIYYKNYVVKPGFDTVLILSDLIGEELIDSGVNCGVSRASEWLQRCLNVLDKKGLKVDGDIGPATITALRSYLTFRGALGERVLFRQLNSLQGAHYINLAERNPSQRRFVFGWFANRVS